MKKDETNSNEKSEDRNDENNRQSEGVNADDMCSICLNPVSNRAQTDTCSHRFCYECLNHWSAVHNRCPVCRQEYRNIRFNFRSADEYEERAVTARESDDETYFQTGFRNGLVAYMNLLSERHELVGRVEQLRREVARIQREQQIISETMRARQMSLDFLELLLVNLEARVSAANPYPSLIEHLYSHVENQSVSQRQSFRLDQSVLITRSDGLRTDETNSANSTIEPISPMPSGPTRVAPPFMSSFAGTDQQTDPSNLSTNRIDSVQTGLNDHNVHQTESVIPPPPSPPPPRSPPPRPLESQTDLPRQPSSASTRSDRRARRRFAQIRRIKSETNYRLSTRHSCGKRQRSPNYMRRRKPRSEKKDRKKSADRDGSEPKE